MDRSALVLRWDVYLELEEHIAYMRYALVQISPQENRQMVHFAGLVESSSKGLFPAWGGLLKPSTFPGCVRGKLEAWGAPQVRREKRPASVTVRGTRNQLFCAAAHRHCAVSSAFTPPPSVDSCAAMSLV